MLSITDAVNAYRHSVYNEVEWKLMHRIDKNSTPYIGGWMASLGEWGNWLARWPKVGFAFLFGFSGDPRDVGKTELPEGIAGTQYGRDLEALRDGMREIADSEVSRVDHYLHLRLQAGYRQNAVIRHQKERLKRVVMPEDAADEEIARGGQITPPPSEDPVSGLPVRRNGSQGGLAAAPR